MQSSNNLTPELIEKIAALAKLDIHDGEHEHLLENFGEMLEMVDVLQSVDTTGVEPLIHISEVTQPLRLDEPAPPLGQSATLANAPATDGEFFRVPKVKG